MSESTNKNIIAGKIVKINKNNLIVAFDGNIGSCHISEVSDYLVKDLRALFTLHEYYDFLVIDKQQFEQYILSYKKIHPKFMKWHYETIETPLGCKNLKESLFENLKKHN